MRDIAVYLPVAPVGGTISRIVQVGGARRILISLRDAVWSVLELKINGTRASEFEIESEKSIWVTVPASLQRVLDERLTVEVYAELKLGARDPRTIPTRFGFGPSPSRATERAEVLQAAIREMMRSPGSDYQNRDSGGGLRQLKSMLISDEASLTRMVVQCVDRFNASRSRNAGRSRFRVTRARLISCRLLDEGTAEREAAVRSLGQDTLPQSLRRSFALINVEMLLADGDAAPTSVIV